MKCKDSACKRVKPGVEVFLERYLYAVKGKRVGLITNHTGINSNLQSVIELFPITRK